MVSPVFKILFLLAVMSKDSLKSEFCDPSEHFRVITSSKDKKYKRHYLVYQRLVISEKHYLKKCDIAIDVQKQSSGDVL